MNALARHTARLLIIADDLSGAADCAVAGLRHGLTTMVLLDAGHASTSTDGVDILSIDVDSRRASKDVAAQRNVAAVESLSAAGTRLYKKVDSTLRGNVAAEVAALALHLGMAIVCPAYPAAGRTTRDGRQWVRGVPVEASEYWRNEHIVGKADLVALLSAEHLRVAHAGFSEVRSSEPGALAAYIRQLQSDGMQAVVCDAESDDDLQRIARASATLDGVFWVGSAGLAPPIIEALALPRSVSGPATDDQHPHGPVLTVVGSMSSISHAQLDCLKANAGPHLVALEVAVSALDDPQSDLTTVVCDALRRGEHVVVSLSQTHRGDVKDGLLFCNRLALLLAPAMPYAGALIATGGETARALLAAAGASALRVVDEIEDGMPLLECRLQGKTFPVVTKAGGFGQPESIHHAWRRLAQERKTADTTQSNQ
ncbi:serine kinase [Burkholderia sp. HI2761]|uniref:four-carbon acid sugar kinase family protein n=1 Tax=unclassified Burkholderia TaxID=2613784 RepID=UPI000B7AB1D7|nr:MULTISPECIES: four-carbon acid sugar kinase family protein [unclassified Burkholderia]MPV59541.1 four-carbon acid sugar kinase family protein [Burkholderia sp. BE24]OXJ24298.1 serine kinase [Burkholderia sp. HI2761]